MKKPALLLTRPSSSAAQFRARLKRGVLDGVQVVVSPLLEIVPTDVSVDIPSGSGVIFTSAHAPVCVAKGSGRAAYCVGERTAQVAREQGWGVLLVAETADDLVGRMEGIGGPLLHLAGRHRRGEIAGRLSAKGIPTQVVVVYDQIEQPLNAEALELLNNAIPVIVPLFSPRSAALFVSQAPNGKNVHIIAMSQAIADALATITQAQLLIASKPTGGEMAHCVEMLLADTTLP